MTRTVSGGEFGEPDTLDIGQSNGALDARTRHVTRIDTERGGATARDGGNLEAGSTRRDPS